MTSVRVSTCIVGGGPAGLMLGLLLAKRGADVLVLEGHENFDGSSGAKCSSRARPICWTSWACWSRIQRRLFFGAPLPPLDPAFSFREANRR